MDSNILYKYFTGELTPAERKNVQAWVELSSENKHEFLLYRSLYDASILTEDFETSIPKHNLGFLRKSIYNVLKIAAIIAVTLVLSYVYRTILNPVQYPMMEVTVPYGQQMNMVLADGTNVWLNSGTTLKYPAMFYGGERRVDVNGEALFNVAKDETCPFYVTTPAMDEIRVLGTSFDVEAYAGTGKFETALLSGRVQIKSNNKIYQLSPDQMISKQSDGRMIISRISDYDAYRWTEGIISLKNDAFPDMIRKFEKFYGVKIVVHRNDLNDVAYSGKFYISDGLRYALAIIKNDLNFDFYIDKDNKIIHIK